MKTKLYCDLFRLTVDHERGGVVGLGRGVCGHAGVVARVRGLQVGEGERAGELVEGVDGHALLVRARELHAVEKPLETATRGKSYVMAPLREINLQLFACVLLSYHHVTS